MSTEQEMSSNKSRISELDPVELKGIISRRTLHKLMSFEDILLERGEQGLLGWLRNNSNNGISPLAKEIGIANATLTKLCDHFGMAHPSIAEMQRKIWQARWQDPEFIRRHAEWSRKSMQERWQDPTFREKMSEAAKEMWEDQELRERRSEELRRRRLDPDFNDKMSKALTEARQDPEYKEVVSQRIRTMWQDPAFRERQASIMQDVYQDPDYKSRHLEGVRRSFEDLEWRERRAEAIRQARRDPDRIGRYKLPTIQGVRRDIGYHAFSAWEANIARVLMYCDRDFYTKEAFSLSVPEEYQNLFPIKTTELTVDFITLDPRGNIAAYEIMAHPGEDPIGWVKLELLISQYPSLNVKPIVPKFYSSIRRHFEKRINENPRFCGWETSKDNLRNNPEKYTDQNSK